MLVVKRAHEQKIIVARMMLLRWMCGYTIMDRLRNQYIREKVGVVLIEEKLRETQRWYGHVTKETHRGSS